MCTKTPLLWWPVSILCIHLANKQHPGEYVCLVETLKTTTKTMIDKWCFPSYPWRFSLLTISALSAEKRITGSYNFKKVYVNTNAIREAWDKLDPCTSKGNNHGWKTALLCTLLSSIWKKDHPNEQKRGQINLWIHRKCVYVCAQGYWWVMDCALVRKSTVPWR